MKTYGEVDVQADVFLTSVLVRNDCGQFMSLSLYTKGKNSPVPIRKKSWRCAELKILEPTETRNSGPSVVQPVASRYADCSTPFL
jgi:hypothetical protein